ncbi:hypothetical protein HCH_00350 [Hahella chejuensis KCTC 2396]|uniref:Uncharacterized protein n=1 Tax=Hahella chejuensis (strain KCTC 2396) TaxID=349521 RepID=Q2SQ12_HAHCH|nr:hypothetical protein HCH_00350 [Hahella chejuensis KCTC 2396]
MTQPGRALSIRQLRNKKTRQATGENILLMQ